jgi:hypothetical protein
LTGYTEIYGITQKPSRPKIIEPPIAYGREFNVLLIIPIKKSPK